MEDIIQALPTALLEAHKIIKAIEEDERRGTTRNTTEALAGTVGAIMGAASAIAADKEKNSSRPTRNFSEVVERAMKVTAAGAAGNQLSRTMTVNALDMFEHDVKETRCNSCKRMYKCRMYVHESREFCNACEFKASISFE